MMVGLSDLAISILAKPGRLQEEAVMQGELSTGQGLPGGLLGGRRRIPPLCRGLVAPGWRPDEPPVLLSTLVECASLITEQCPAKGLM